jgi:hypothetical protein
MYFACHHREAAAFLACARRVAGGIQHEMFV